MRLRNVPFMLVITGCLTLLLTLAALSVKNTPVNANVIGTDPTVEASLYKSGVPDQTLTYATNITRAGTIAKIYLTLPSGATLSGAPRGITNTGAGTWSVSGSYYVFTLANPYSISTGTRVWAMLDGITFAPGTASGAKISVYNTSNVLLSNGLVSGPTFTAPTACATSMPTNYIQTENAKAGTADWRLKSYNAATAEAYASKASAKCGDTVNIYVNSSTYKLSVTAYRVGYYNGAGARQVMTTSGGVYSYAQPAPLFIQNDAQGRDISMYTAKNWSRTFSIKIDGSFTPGAYLLKVVDETGAGSYVPLVVRDDVGYHDKTILTSYATTAAYNTWGGASAYTSPLRSKRVSFDRPIDLYQGAGMFLTLDYGFITWAEQQGLDVNYAADIDLHSMSLYDHTKTVVLMAHTEYWSAVMRDRVDTALAAGKNLASFGGNQMYWRILPGASTTTGANREYDIFRTADTETNNFRYATPTQAAKPEQLVLGSMFGCMHMDSAITPNSTWLWNGVDKTPIQHYYGGETDMVFSNFAQPSGLQILNSDTLNACDVGTTAPHADVTAVIHSGGGRVFNASTHNWGCTLGGQCAYGVPTTHARQQLSQATMNVFSWLDTRTTSTTTQNNFTLVKPKTTLSPASTGLTTLNSSFSTQD